MGNVLDQLEGLSGSLERNWTTPSRKWTDWLLSSGVKRCNKMLPEGEPPLKESDILYAPIKEQPGTDLVKNILGAVKSFGGSLQDSLVDDPEQWSRGFNYGLEDKSIQNLLEIMGGVGGTAYTGGRYLAPDGATLGIFAGSNAAKANKELMRKFPHTIYTGKINADDYELIKWAEEEPDKVFDETGIFTLGDKRLRFEIDDRDMKVVMNDDLFNTITKDDYGKGINEGNSFTLPVYDIEEIFSHPELFKNYPHLKNAKVRFVNDPKGGFGRAKFGKDGNPNIIELNVGRGILDKSNPEQTKEQFLDIAVHELQHLVDNYEGMPQSGGSPLNTFTNDAYVGNALQNISKIIESKYAGHDRFISNSMELGNLSTAQLIKGYLAKSKQDGIKPAELRRQGEFYRYSDDIYSELGAPPKKPSIERDLWYNRAFKILADKIADSNPGAAKLLSMEDKNISANIRRLQKALKADRKDFDEYNDFWNIEDKMLKEFGEYDDFDEVNVSPRKSSENMNIYLNLLGEMAGRAVQARRGKTIDLSPFLPGDYTLHKYHRPDNPLYTFGRPYSYNADEGKLGEVLTRHPLNKRTPQRNMELPPLLGLVGAFK